MFLHVFFRCQIAIDYRIYYLKTSSLSEDILALLRTKKQDSIKRRINGHQLSQERQDNSS